MPATSAGMTTFFGFMHLSTVLGQTVASAIQRIYLFDHLVGAGQQNRRDVDALRSGGSEIDQQLELVRRLHRQVLGLGAAQPRKRSA
jgi:hypothetical protein